MYKYTLWLCVFCAFVFTGCTEEKNLGCYYGMKNYPVIQNIFHSPHYPLITIDPTMNAWMRNDTLYKQNSQHPNGKELPLLGVVRVDGRVYRFMGTEKKTITAYQKMGFEAEWEAKYTFFPPKGDWTNKDYDDHFWTTGKGAFGTREMLEARTKWSTHTNDLWMRKEINIDPKDLTDKRFYLRYSYDENLEVYINGILLLKRGTDWHFNLRQDIPDHIVETMKDGRVVIALHGHNEELGALLDFGLYAENKEKPIMSETAQQVLADIQATQTHYVFHAGPMELKVDFVAPLLIDKVDVLVRPVNYISYELTSSDGEEHEVEIYFELSPDWVLHRSSEQSETELCEKNGLRFIKTGNQQQAPFKWIEHGRSNWGYLYFGGEKAYTTMGTGDASGLRKAFAHNGVLPQTNEQSSYPYMAIAQSLGKGTTLSGKVFLGYDATYSCQYYGESLRPYWNYDGEGIEKILTKANTEFDKIHRKCYSYDYDLMDKIMLTNMPVADYRRILSGYRAARTAKGELIYFTNELAQINTTHRIAPLFLQYDTELLKGMINPLVDYCHTDMWQKPYPPNDLGTYPFFIGQSRQNDIYPHQLRALLSVLDAIRIKDGHNQYHDKNKDVINQWESYYWKFQTVEKPIDGQYLFQMRTNTF